MSHAACRRAFGAYRAPTTHSGPWPSGGGRDAIAAGSRVGLLRYFSARPSFFFTAPARKPRTLCFCQPVASSRSSIVAPSRRPSRSRHVCCLVCLRAAGLVPLRMPTAPFLRGCHFGAFVVPAAFFAFERRWRLAGSTGSAILVSSTGLDLAIGWCSPCATAPHARCFHHPKPRNWARRYRSRWPDAFSATNSA